MSLKFDVVSVLVYYSETGGNAIVLPLSLVTDV